MSDTPRSLSKGTRVEIYPYGPNYFHAYLGHLDGERGVAEGIKGHGENMKVVIKLDNSKYPVELPVKAVRPIPEAKV